MLLARNSPCSFDAPNDRDIEAELGTMIEDIHLLFSPEEIAAYLYKRRGVAADRYYLLDKSGSRRR